MASQKKLYGLQVYRGIAALLVVLYHMTYLSQERFDYQFLGGIFAFGFTGVDFFFVLSGFIILYVHGRDLGRPERLRGYFTKRFIRLYPIYWCVALTKIVVILLVPSLAKSYEANTSYLAKSLLLIPQENLPIIGAAWTLSYEVLFYILFGITILLGVRWAYRLTVIWVVAIAVVYGLNQAGWIPSEYYIALNFIFNERNLEFILGCWAARTVINSVVKYAKTMALVGLVAFILLGAYLNHNQMALPFSLTFGLASFLLVLGTASVEMSGGIAWPRPLVFLGDASYSVYLTHVMFLNFFMLIIGRLNVFEFIDPLFTTSLLVVGSVLGGCLVYLLVERPIIVSLRKKLLPNRAEVSIIGPGVRKTTVAID